MIPGNSYQAVGPGPLEEFVDSAIDDPGALASLSQQLQRPKPPSPARSRWASSLAGARALLSRVLLRASGFAKQMFGRW
jgi:hypothetical protein